MSKKQEPGAAVRATIRDVASAAKTGKTSVSRYLNGEQHLLSDSLKERIGRAISLLDYQPSQMARSLKKRPDASYRADPRRYYQSLFCRCDARR